MVLMVMYGRSGEWNLRHFLSPEAANPLVLVGVYPFFLSHVKMEAGLGVESPRRYASTQTES